MTCRIANPLDDRREKFIVSCSTVGAAGAGKTTLLRKFKSREYEVAPATVGVDFVEARVEMDGEIARLILYDTAGTERFASLTRAYIRNSMVVFLVFSYDNEDSFIGLAQKRQLIHEVAPDAIVVLVGTKADLLDSPCSEWCKSLDMEKTCAILECNGGFFSVAAKSTKGDSVDAPFFHAVCLHAKRRESKPRETVSLLSTETKRKRCCH